MFSLSLALLAFHPAPIIRHAIQPAASHGKPLAIHMKQDPKPKTEARELNPVKIVVNVIAQAEIVGVEAPKLPKFLQAPPPQPSQQKAFDFNYDSTHSTGTSPMRLPNGARREVDRDCVHPLLKLGDGFEAVLTAFLALPKPILYAHVLPALAVLAPVLGWFVAARKAQWAEEVAASAEEHREAFEANWNSYLKQQRKLVGQLLAARSHGERDYLLPPADMPFTVAVTMATGQEGQAVVRALSAAVGAMPNARVRALVRNPSSAKAMELAALPRVEVVQADSLDAPSLRSALEGADAAYLCTTLNTANAGTWEMGWDGGKYEVEQGLAFAEAARGLNSLKQVVYGTAPERKWPEAYRVEPPIHYAAKWKIEEIVQAAGLPLTCLRKCPYHENFTKLTKAKQAEDEEGKAKGFWAPGTYFIKALTPPSFEYNMLGPGDIGEWAILALTHPTILGGKSLSIAADSLTGQEMAEGATRATAFGPGVDFAYTEQPRWLFEALSFVEPTFVYISGLQRWNSDGGRYDLHKEDVKKLRELHAGLTWEEHLQKDGLDQFTSTMAELLPDAVKS